MSDTVIAPEATTSSFADFGVEPALVESLAAVGITSPFPIQELTLPLALSGADIIGQARTGTGKTLGFGLPLLQRLDTAKGLQALVIVPTRELCLQVSEDLAQAGRSKGVKVVALYGGKAMQPQIDALVAGAQLVVGTPGRLLDLSRRGFLDLSGCKALVLDEADEMLDLGFLPDVEQLVEQCDDDRQTLLFSATMPAQIVSLARRYMTKPTFMRADVEEVRIAPQTTQHFFSCHRMDKPAVLARILQTPERGLCVVFCRTKRMADILAEELRDRDVPAQAIHSDLRQDARERALQKFRDGTTTVLCATEVAARGLDIDHVTHVVNYDIPDDEKMYLHRIGRTGRAGGDGVAITFAVYNEIPRLEMIRRELGIAEEIQEVFSTSPLLEELFDLPPREQRSKVASPPPRAGTGRTAVRRDREAGDGGERDAGREGGRGRGGRRSRDAQDDTAEAREGGRGRGEGRGDRDEGRGGREGGRGGREGGRGGRRTERVVEVVSDRPAAVVATAVDESAAHEAAEHGSPRVRRRRRSRGGVEGSPGSDAVAPVVFEDDEVAVGADDVAVDEVAVEADEVAVDEVAVEADEVAVEADEVAVEADEVAVGESEAVEPDAAGVVATRTRVRGRERGGREGRERTRTVRVPATPAEDPARTSRGRATGRGQSGRDQSGSAKADGRAKGEGRGSGGDGRGKGEGRNKSGESRSKSGERNGRASREDGRANGQGDREGRGGRNGSRGRSDRVDRGDREGRDERTRRAATVDTGEARGEGKPRLSRKLEVTHLP